MVRESLRPVRWKLSGRFVLALEESREICTDRVLPLSSGRAKMVLESAPPRVHGVLFLRSRASGHHIVRIVRANSAASPERSLADRQRLLHSFRLVQERPRGAEHRSADLQLCDRRRSDHIPLV